MPLFLIILFIVVPIAELYVIVQVGQAIGIWPTLALLLADALLGSFLLKHQGRGAWRRFNEALAQGRFPGREVVDGLLIVVGGTLLLAPGFITDIAGLILLIPPTRAIVRGVLRRFTIGRVAILGMGVPGGGSFGMGGRGEGERGGADGRGSAGRGSTSRPRSDYDYEATAEEVPLDPDARSLPRDRSE